MTSIKLASMQRLNASIYLDASMLTLVSSFHVATLLESN